MTKYITIVLVNVLLFIALRVMNILLITRGNSLDIFERQQIWDFLPAYLIQAGLLLIFFVRKSRQETVAGIIYIACLLLITGLYLLSYFEVIPATIVPF